MTMTVRMNLSSFRSYRWWWGRVQPFLEHLHQRPQWLKRGVWDRVTKLWDDMTPPGVSFDLQHVRPALAHTPHSCMLTALRMVFWMGPHLLEIRGGEIAYPAHDEDLPLPDNAVMMWIPHADQQDPDHPFDCRLIDKTQWGVKCGVQPGTSEFHVCCLAGPEDDDETVWELTWAFTSDHDECLERGCLEKGPSLQLRYRDDERKDCFGLTMRQDHYLSLQPRSDGANTPVRGWRMWPIIRHRLDERQTRDVVQWLMTQDHA